METACRRRGARAADLGAGPDAPHGGLRLLRRHSRRRASRSCTRRATSRLTRPTSPGDEMLKNLGQIPLAHQPGTVCGILDLDGRAWPADRAGGEKAAGCAAEGDAARSARHEETRHSGWSPEKAGRLAESLDADPLKAANAEVVPGCLESGGQRATSRAARASSALAQDYLKFCQMMVNGGEYQGKRYLSKRPSSSCSPTTRSASTGSPYPTTGPGYAMGLGFRRAAGRRHGLDARLERRCHVGRAPGAPASGSIRRKVWWDILMAQGPSTGAIRACCYKDLVYGAMVKWRLATSVR